MKTNKSTLITIVGPTASGKTDLALALAEEYHGEIICADSRTIYRGMDIGTAKPTPEEQARVPHHLLDVVEPNEVLSVAAFKDLAEAAIQQIGSRGHTPFLVGGSGLYVDAILFDYQFPPQPDSQRRAALEELSGNALRELLAAEDPVAFERVDLANRRRLIRALETVGQPVGRSHDLRPRTLVLGMGMNKEIIRGRVVARIEKMLEKGFLDEVRRLGETYGWESEALTGVGYRAFKDVVLGTKTVEEGAADFARGDMALVKKQLTWFKRNPAIVWLYSPAEARPLVDNFLAAQDV